MTKPKPDIQSLVDAVSSDLETGETTDIKLVEEAPAEAEPDDYIDFGALSHEAKVRLASDIRDWVSEERKKAAGEGGTDALLKNIQDQLIGATNHDLAGESFKEMGALARLNAQTQTAHIPEDRFPACDATISLKLPRASKHHLQMKSLGRSISLSEYIVECLNMAARLDEDDHLILVRKRGGALASKS
ncbi:MAG: hypothetical protein AAFP81_19315 [Pseudomonadota bacterium]